jgi:class 3 adenylate cyclase
MQLELLYVPVAVLAFVSALLVALALWLWRLRAQALRSKDDTESVKTLKNFLYSVAYTLVTAGSQTQVRPQENIANAKEMAFVVTDIEGSTQLSVLVPEVYDQMLEIHDQLMREGIARFHG